MHINQPIELKHRQITQSPSNHYWKTQFLGIPPGDGHLEIEIRADLLIKSVIETRVEVVIL